MYCKTEFSTIKKAKHFFPEKLRIRHGFLVIGNPNDDV